VLDDASMLLFGAEAGLQLGRKGNIKLAGRIYAPPLTSGESMDGPFGLASFSYGFFP
jgi:hypothetical protein